MKWAEVYHADTNLGKLKGTLIDYVTFKWGVSHKWYDELSRLIERFLDADVMEQFLVWWPIYSVILTFKCCGTSTVLLSQCFTKISLWAKVTPE